MLRMLSFLPLMLLLAAPAFAQKAEPSRQLTRSYRSGKGQPRERDATAARTYSPGALNATGATARSRPYQVPKPGEGAPKA